MYLVFRVLLLIVYIGICIHCHGGTDDGGSSTGSSRTYNYYYGSSDVICTTSDCRANSAIILGTIIGGILGLSVLLIGSVFCYNFWKGRARRRNSDYVNLSNKKDNGYEAYDANLFKSGYWSSRYFQHETWYGPHQFFLSFDPQSMKITGSGSDNIGTFTIDGIYSLETRRIGLTKIYKVGTVNWSRNLGPKVTIQLTWKPHDHLFDGKWYVHTDQYHGENHFELKFDKE